MTQEEIKVAENGHAGMGGLEVMPDIAGRLIEPSQEAREIYADEARKAGFKSWGDAIADPTDVILESDQIALRAIERALQRK